VILRDKTLGIGGWPLDLSSYPAANSRRLSMTKFEKAILEELKGIKEALEGLKPSHPFTWTYVPTYTPPASPYIGDPYPWTTICGGSNTQQGNK
jgi:hypothetical protein